MTLRSEPAGLPPDEAPIGDFSPVANWKADARRGSEKLKRAILRSSARKFMRDAPPKRDYIRRAAKRYGTWSERQLAFAQIERLQRAVAAHYGLPFEAMKGGRGTPEAARKRQIAMFLARHIIQCSYPDIGRCFERDHSTVMYAIRAVEARIATDPAAGTEIEALRKALAR